MNTHDMIELPPLPPPFKEAVYATSANTKSVRDGVEMGGYEKEPPLFDDAQMHEYALAAIATYQQGGNAKQRYDEIMKDDTEEPDPIEDLRFFCSLAMSGQDWLDAEPFFDALVAVRKRGGEPVDIRQEVIETLEMILAADWRKWEELASPDEFVRWAKSRANYALSIINEAPQPAEPVKLTQCGLCHNMRTLDPKEPPTLEEEEAWQQMEKRNDF